MKRTIVSAAICLVAAATFGADVPRLIHYQGRLLAVNGEPINGTPDMTVAIYTNPTIGASVFTQHVGAVVVQDGMFEFSFGGESSPLAEALAHPGCWLELTVDGSPLSPRQRLVSAPYALHVLNAVLVSDETALGAGASAKLEGAAVGADAVADTGGAALGASAAADFFGSALGYETLAFNVGTAVGFQAQGYNTGVAIGPLARASYTNIALGAYAHATGAGDGTARYRTAIGVAVTNLVDNSTAIRGDLYLDGGQSIRMRKTFGSGSWTTYPDGWTGTVTSGVQRLHFTNGILMDVSSP